MLFHKGRAAASRAFSGASQIREFGREWSYLGLLMLLVEGAARHDDEGANLLLGLPSIVEVGGEVFLAVAKVAASNRLGVA